MGRYLIRRIHRGACALALGLLLVSAPRAEAQSSPDTSLSVILAKGYSILATDPQEASCLFESALLIAPRSAGLHRQLGYLYHAQGFYDRALQHFMAAESVASSDTVRLQIAYTLLGLGRTSDARKLCQELAQSPSSGVRESASRQLDALPPEARFLPRWWTRVYASPYYDTRWNTSFYYLHLQEGYDILGARLLTLYGFLTASGDARSQGGMVPVLFSDNTLIEGIGLQYRPLAGLTLSVQEGLAFDLIDKASRSPVRGDFRATCVYGNGWYPPLALRNRLASPWNPFLDVYTSLGYYSRYQEGIGYLQGRLGSRVLTFSTAAMDIYAKGSLVMDTEKHFYDNVLEGGVGARLTPNPEWGVFLAGEWYRGYYTARGSADNPYARYYSSFRLFLIIDKTF